MEKIETIFDRGDDFKVTSRVRVGTEWVFSGEGMATEKLDGTNIQLTIGQGQVVKIEKRRNPNRAEKEKGIEPSYVDAHSDDPQDKHIFRAVQGTDVTSWADGVFPCEAVGPKIQGNPLQLASPTCYPFTLNPTILDDVPRSFDGLKSYLADFESRYSKGFKGEGIVFHHPDGRMAKIKVRDFKQ